jgi:type VI secretion system secreted protein Hcp
MAADMFLKIGALKGEARDAVHKGEMDVVAWSWGMTQSGSTHVGGGGGSGKVDVQDIQITKYVDRSSPSLYAACCQGTHFDQAILVVRKAGGKPLEYLKITMSEVLITAVSPSARGQDRILENISLNFARFKVEYTPQQPDGTGAAPVVANWDIAGQATA